MLSLCACLVSHYFYRYSWLFLLSLSDVPREILVFSPMRSRLQRTAVGIALLPEEPCIESIQSALRHSIWHKTSHTQVNVDGKWDCYGIPQQLFLDNAWAHHSHSLENLAR